MKVNKHVIHFVSIDLTVLKLDVQILFT